MDLVPIAGSKCEGFRSLDIVLVGEPVIHVGHLLAVYKKFRNVDAVEFHGGDVCARKIEAVAGASCRQRPGDSAAPGDLIEMGKIFHGGNIVKFPVHSLKCLSCAESGIGAHGGAADGRFIRMDQLHGSVREIHMVEVTVFRRILIGVIRCRNECSLFV